MLRLISSFYLDFSSAEATDPHCEPLNRPTEVQNENVTGATPCQKERNQSGRHIEISHRPFKSRIWKPHVLKRILLINLFVLLRQFSGAFVVIMYAVDIFASAGDALLSPNHCAIVIGSVQLSVVLFSNAVTDVVGRKKLIVASGVMMSLSHFAVAVFYLAKSSDKYHLVAQDHFSWVPLVSLMIFIGFYALGFAPALFIFMIELIPQDVRASVSSITLTTNSFANFVILHAYYRMKETLGEAGLFGCYGTFCVTAAIFCKLVLPETKGKTFAEIEAECK
jgi:SP family facilitated glucose transporter-like MFS transporter 8